MLQDNEDQKGIEQLVMAVIVTKKGTSIDSPKDIVVTSLEGVPRAYYVLLGLTYALNLHYPRHLKYTLRYFRNLSWSWIHVKIIFLLPHEAVRKQDD
uniref:Uncharacterized protein n=1 Tax=Sinocyclocheilus rhinocerous TaxID=307959 RepID=A0A673I5W2_9TELE